MGQQMENRQGGDLSIGFQRFAHSMKKIKFDNTMELKHYMEEPSGSKWARKI